MPRKHGWPFAPKSRRVWAYENQRYKTRYDTGPIIGDGSLARYPFFYLLLCVLS